MNYIKEWSVVTTSNVEGHFVPFIVVWFFSLLQPRRDARSGGNEKQPEFSSSCLY